MWSCLCVDPVFLLKHKHPPTETECSQCKLTQFQSRRQTVTVARGKVNDVEEEIPTDAQGRSVEEIWQQSECLLLGLELNFQHLLTQETVRTHNKINEVKCFQREKEAEDYVRACRKEGNAIALFLKTNTCVNIVSNFNVPICCAPHVCCMADLCHRMEMLLFHRTCPPMGPGQPFRSMCYLVQQHVDDRNWMTNVCEQHVAIHAGRRDTHNQLARPKRVKSER